MKDFNDVAELDAAYGRVNLKKVFTETPWLFSGWVEAGIEVGSRCELRVTPKHAPVRPFWLPLTCGTVMLGWIHFRVVGVIRGEVVFEASELRLASDPAPAEQDIWPPF
jgi:hypothetical protein